jgi:Ca2+-binding RTX toxin-like protein
MPKYGSGNISSLAYQINVGYWEWSGYQGTQPRFFTNPNPGNPTEISVNITALQADHQAIAILALGVWQDVANIQFTYTTGAADITYNDLPNPDGSAEASCAHTTFYDALTNRLILTSSTVDVSLNWEGGPGTTPWNYFFQTMVHETGHALGLGHSGNYNDGFTNSYYNTDSTIYANDTWQWSIMSYNDQAQYGSTRNNVLTPQMADIYAIQSTYGAATTTRTGDSTYGFNSNLGDLYDFDYYADLGVSNAAPSFTIYDSGGNDTLDCSGFTVGQIINLRGGSWSSIGNFIENIGIYTTVVIENAYGGSASDTLYGNEVDNILDGRGGIDSMSGFGGNDTYFIDDIGDVVVEEAVGGNDWVRVTLTSYVLSANIENLDYNGDNLTDFSGTGNEADNTIQGWGGNDVLSALGGNDCMRGYAGNDTLDGGAGADTMSGASGDDTYFVDNLGDSIVDDANAGIDHVFVLSDYTLNGGAEVEALSAVDETGTETLYIFGNEFTNTITGNAGVNGLVGGDGDDVIYGLAGADGLDGGSGDDTVYGGDGDDIIEVDSAGDVVIEEADQGTDRVDSYVSWTLADNIEDLVLYGAATDLDGTGNSRNNVINGSGGNNLLSGLEGDDYLLGYTGTDTLQGGEGDDTLSGGEGDDRVIGGAGDDLLTGGDDSDTAVFDGAWADYLLTWNLDGSITVALATGDAAADTLAEFEFIEIGGDLRSVADLNFAPLVSVEIADQSVAEDTEWIFTVPAGTFTDPEGDTLSYSATLSGGAPLPEWLAFDPESLTFTGTPPADFNGVVSLTVTASDGLLAASDTFDLSVTAVNDPPVQATAMPDQNAAEDVGFIYTIPDGTFIDFDPGDTLSYSATLENGDPLPGWLEFDSQTRTFSGTPTASDIGAIEVWVTVTDADNTSITGEFDILIGNTNDPPTVIAAIPDQAATEDAVFTFAVPAGTFADSDPGDSLVYAATLDNGDPLPGWLQFDATTRTFSGTAENGDVGTLAVRVTATDASNVAISDTFNLVIANTDDAPALANEIADQSAAEDTEFTFALPPGTFADVDAGDTLSFAATLDTGDPLPGWLQFDGTLGVFTGTPGSGDIGTAKIRVTATDSSGATATDTFDIAVNNTNDAPTLVTAIADQAATEDAAFVFELPAWTFADSDTGDTLTYTASLDSGEPLPSWLAFDDTTRTFSGTPGNGHVGTVKVRVTATDSASAAVSDTFDIVVANTNDAPTAIALAPATIAENAAAGTLVGTLTGSDPDAGDSLTFSLTDDADGTFVLAGSAIALAEGASIDFETSTSYEITVVATDESGATFEQSLTISVTDIIEPIVGSPTGNQMAGTGGTDILLGLGGNDTLEGLAGADELDGGKGKDTASYANAESGVVANLADPGENEGDAAGDTYIDIENLVGSAFADRLVGNGKKNTLDGGAGDDLLTGGGKRDTFVFGFAYGRDTITDFDHRGADQDVVDLSDAAGIRNFKDLLKNHIEDIGSDLVVTARDGSELILERVGSIKQLTSGDFLF